MEELEERGEDNLSPQEKIKLSSHRDYIDEFYRELYSFGIDWILAYKIYNEISDYRIISDGYIVGVDVNAVKVALSYYEFTLDEEYQMFRRIRIIDRVMTDIINEYLRQRVKSAQTAQTPVSLPRPVRRFR